MYFSVCVYVCITQFNGFIISEERQWIREKKKVMTQFCVCSPDYWVRPWSAVTYSKFIINQNDVEIPFVRKMFSQHVMTCPHHSSLNRTMMTCTVLYLITMLTSTQLCKSIIREQQHQTMVLGSVCCVVCIHIPDLLNI